jgi:tRNA modification GTPase
MTSSPSETICALSTPHGVGGIAVLRVSGPLALSVSQAIVKKPLNESKVREAQFRAIMDGDQILDEAVLTYYQSPASFTGEDVVEIAVHGSRYIQQRLLQVLLEKGCRLAQPGEYTMRAYLNGKLDLSRAEAVGDVIAAESAAAHRQAVHQMRGGFSQEIDGLREKLIQFSSLLELELDFAEEDVEFADRSALVKLLAEIERVVVRLRESFRLGNAIKNGIPTAIVGAPNAGKSTLLNALLNEERAIVSDIAGTTRDTVEEVLHLNGVQFRLIDTAGIRETQDTIEQMGIARSWEKASHAELILWLVDGSHCKAQQLQDEWNAIAKIKREEAQVLLVVNKQDVGASSLTWDATPVFCISARDKQGLETLTTEMSQRYLDDLQGQDTIVTNARHHEALGLALTSLRDVQNGMQQGLSSDLLAIDIRNTLYHLASITGAVSADDILHSIFSKFCIGK